MTAPASQEAAAPAPAPQQIMLYTLQFAAPQVDVIAAALAQMPYGQVSGVMESLRGQVTTQNMAFKAAKQSAPNRADRRAARATERKAAK